MDSFRDFLEAALQAEEDGRLWEYFAEVKQEIEKPENVSQIVRHWNNISDLYSSYEVINKF